MLKVVVNKREGFTPEEIKKHETASQLLETALNSVEFRDGVLTLPLENMNGLTHQQVYDKIMSGAEVLTPEVDNELDVWAVVYYKNNKVVGYTNPTTILTWINRKFFGDDYADIACNMLHEWLHKLGFDHDSASDHDSVPYALGYFVEKLIRRLMNGEKLTMIGDVPPVIIPDTVPAAAVERVLVCSRIWYMPWRKKCHYEYRS